MIILMSSYDVIAQFYDSVVTDPTEKALWLKQLIQKHYPASKSVFELACGTGGILEVLATDYQVTGLDNSAEMLKVARKRLPNTEFIQASMADFNIERRFSAVLCIYDSINHLLLFSEWQSMFEKVAQHLEPGGLFIFDMNTVEFLHKLNESEPSVSHFSDNTMTIGAEPNEEAITTLKVEVREQKLDGTSQTYKTDIPETSFDIQEVQKALEEHFEVLEKLGEQRFTNWTENDNKIVFVCRLR
jgi:trans-aconitate methyltransferase